jgi:hypothetical protein
MAFEKVTADPVAAFLVLFKGVPADSFTVLGGPTNVFSTKAAATQAAVDYVNGGGYFAIVAGADNDAAFRQTP